MNMAQKLGELISTCYWDNPQRSQPSENLLSKVHDENRHRDATGNSKTQENRASFGESKNIPSH